MPTGTLTPVGKASDGGDLLAGLKDLKQDLPQEIWEEWIQNSILGTLNHPAVGYGSAYCKGQGGCWLYEHDGPGVRQESLVWLRPNRSQDSKELHPLKGVTLSEQPLGWARKDPPGPVLKLVDLDLNIKATDGTLVQVTSEETVVPMVPGMQALRFLPSGTGPSASPSTLGKRTTRSGSSSSSSASWIPMTACWCRSPSRR